MLNSSSKRGPGSNPIKHKWVNFKWIHIKFTPEHKCNQLFIINRFSRIYSHRFGQFPIPYLLIPYRNPTLCIARLGRRTTAAHKPHVNQLFTIFKSSWKSKPDPSIASLISKKNRNHPNGYKFEVLLVPSLGL